MKKIIAIVCLLVVFTQSNLSYASTGIAQCSTGSIEGDPPIHQIPTYSYGEDGLLQFHFHFTSGEWNYNTLKLGLYDESCNEISNRGYGQVGGVYLPPANNILVKVAEYENNPGYYNFKVFNEDTGEFYGTGLGFTPNDFESPRIGLALSNVVGNYYNPDVDIIYTPVAPMRIAEVQPERNPVLIIPGAMGSELFKGEKLVWPNISEIALDVNDNFLDDLAFNADLSPVNSSIAVGDIIRSPFPGEHYYDELIASLESTGYTENIDLFVFPYDWRFGLNSETIESLRQRIEDLAVHGPVNVIAHSTGGLLVKHAINNSSSALINNLILVGVPNYGAPKAIQTLLQGDSLGIPLLDKKRIKYIAQNMPIMYDLAPTQQYNLNKKFFNSMEYHEAVEYLVNKYNLNESAFAQATSRHNQIANGNSSALPAENVFTIAGCKVPTLTSMFEIINPLLNVLPDYPIQKVFGTGDGTVPLFSGIGQNDNKFFVLHPNHSKLPSQNGVTALISEVLQHNSAPSSIPEDIITNESDCYLNGKQISIDGNVDFEIKNLNGDVLFGSNQSENFTNTESLAAFSLDNHHSIFLSNALNDIKIEFSLNNSQNASPVSEQIQILVHHIVDDEITPSSEIRLLPIINQNQKLSLFLTEPEPRLEYEQSGSNNDNPNSNISTNIDNKSSSGSKRKYGFKAKAHKEGSLIKSGKTIYRIENGQRRGFRDFQEFLTYGYDLATIVEANLADMSLPEGFIVLAKPGSLIKDISTVDNYYVINPIFQKSPVYFRGVVENLIKSGQKIFEINLKDYSLSPY